MSSLQGPTSSEKRRAQNRIAQRKFRDRKKAHVAQMVEERNRMAEKEERLRSEIASLQARLGHNDATKDQDQRIGGISTDDVPPEHILESIEMPDTVAHHPPISTSPPDFSLPDFEEHSNVLSSEDWEREPASLPSQDFSSHPQTNVALNDIQFSFTPRVSTPLSLGPSASEVGTQEQMSLMTMQDTSLRKEHPNNSSDHQSGLFADLGFDESLPISSVHLDPYTTNFQVMQLLEVAKHKEHAARLLQEAAYCREYTVRSLLTTQGAWAPSASEYPLGTCSTSSQYAYNPELDAWNWNNTSFNDFPTNVQTQITAA